MGLRQCVAMATETLRRAQQADVGCAQSPPGAEAARVEGVGVDCTRITLDIFVYLCVFHRSFEGSLLTPFTHSLSFPCFLLPSSLKEREWLETSLRPYCVSE